ncbi:PREDICTED: phospholipase A1-like [Trachymyrmex cornetzi]|uniref:phospholipase A1-like n=1 Tax=Trachymyrmex cornetzi TaxID=471704 RepID=UPI00084F3424|nr:PREDICTED: phospholipase A1-like [Trachymyrmex cornetzi]XP_018371790.1 PREDICTED: phospholipase A1-like [Trachymyrmex cornetzi]XP_018371791.1 PREDICTED: phospholipase A1-like [Trachymyrmex cornetzi]
MMQLATIASFLILFCGLFGTITVTTVTSSDHDAMTVNDVSVNRSNGSTSCILGVKHVSIALYTSDIPNGKFVQVNESCNFLNSSTSVFFMTHGFIGTYSNYNLSVVASQLVKKHYAVFSLDWSDAACYNDLAVIKLLEYPFAVHNTREVGNYLASYIKSICDTCSVPFKNIALIGHSLGAHISSFAAKNLHTSGYGKVSLLIGSDPAGPLFMLNDCENRFCNTDGERVVALHTSGLGLQKSLGQLDLFYNNGLSQPACGGQIIGSLNVNCSHNICIMYLASMWSDDCVFIGVPIHPRIGIPGIKPGCSDSTNCIMVDSKIFYNTTIVGNYCVSVASKYPFCVKKDEFKCQKVTSILDILI